MQGSRSLPSSERQAEERAIRAFKLRYDRLAGWLSRIGLLDVALGLALILQRPQSRRAAGIRAIAGLALYGTYYLATREFVGTLFFAALQGLILSLLSRRAEAIILYPT